jgi:hypothetical protein
MDEAPSRLGTHELEDLPARVKQAAEQLEWIDTAAVRLREHGHLITGEVLVVPRNTCDLVARLESARQQLSSLDWRLHSLTLMPVANIPPREPARS